MWRLKFHHTASKCDQIRKKLQIWSHLMNKSLMGNFIFCAVSLFKHWSLLLLLTYFWPMFLFYCSWKLQNIKDFLMLPGGINWEHWPDMSKDKMTNQGVYIKSNVIKSYNNVSRRQTQRSSVKKLNRIYRKTLVMGFFSSNVASCRSSCSEEYPWKKISNHRIKGFSQNFIFNIKWN